MRATRSISPKSWCCCSTPRAGSNCRISRSPIIALEEGRALIIAINKWDVAEDASGLFNGIRAALDEGLAQLKGVPLVAVSALTGKGLDQMLAAAFELREAWSRRVPTAALNRWFDHALGRQSAPRARRQADQAALHHPGRAPARRAS